MRKFSKCIISLDGVSSQIANIEPIKKNLAMGLRAAGLEYSYYQHTEDGFIGLEMDMNQPDTLYVLNDSLTYHLCQQPCILLTRSWPWVESNPKPNCIGVLTHEMIGYDYSELVGIICRDKMVRQHHNGLAAHTYLLFSQHFPSTSEAMGRYAAAQTSWAILRQKDIHVRYLPYVSDSLPYVSTMLKEAMEYMEHPDDIVILLNSDIILTPESTAIIRAFMDSRNIDACYASRVDTGYGMHHTYGDLQECLTYLGMDLFAIRRDAPIAKKLTQTPLLLGREGWDTAWASVIKHRLPYSICYHWAHDAEWRASSTEEGNQFNRAQIKEHFLLRSVPMGEGVGFYPQY